MSRLRWRAIARCLGVPRRRIRQEARVYVQHQGHHDVEPAPWTLPVLREWCEWTLHPPHYIALSLGPDGLRIEDI